MTEATPYTLCYYSATALEITALGEAVRQYQSQYGRIAVMARTQVQLFDAARVRDFAAQAVKADVIILSLHGGKASCPAFDAVISAVEKRRTDKVKTPYLHIQPTAGDVDALGLAEAHSPDFNTSRWRCINDYLCYGGHVNLKCLLMYLHQLLVANTGVHCPPPFPLPDHGIYHPDLAEPPLLETYLENRVDPKKPTVGLWFYQTYWVNNDLAHMDAIIREIEARGANVIPVFHHRYKDAVRGNQGAGMVARHYFMAEETPRIDVLVNPLMFSLTLAAPEYREILPGLNVPCIQAILTTHPRKVWAASVQGLGPTEVSFSAAQPEFDGALITVPVAAREQEQVDPLTGARIAKYVPIGERVEKMVRLALNWARLRRTPNARRRVAVIFHHYPPRNDRIGCAAGLDSFESVKHLLDALQQEGYCLDRTYESGDVLSKELLERVTGDRRWLTPERMAEKAEAHAGPEHYTPWYEALPPVVREKMIHDWGPIPGEHFVHDRQMLFAGLHNGNLFITIQPPRGSLEKVQQLYHNMHLSPPHHYLAHYRYIRDIFGAHAVIHVGKHGSLEWLPGKALGLSERCYPDLAIMELPNIYPYIINDPGEGTQAKRRAFCCIIDHLTPAFTNADLYDRLETVAGHVRAYTDARREDPAKLPIIRPMIWEAVRAAELDNDLAVDETTAMADFDGFLERLHDYLSDLSDTMINDGLHVMGQAPSGRRLVEFLVQLTRLPNGPVPSLREAVIAAMGFDPEAVLESRGKSLPAFGGATGGEIVQKAHETALELVSRMTDTDLDPEKAAVAAAANVFDPPPAPLIHVLEYIAATLVPRIRKTFEELTACLRALGGGFIRPGPSGAPTRGQADILPTGRNFYSVDPNKIPTPSAWETGKRLGDALIQRYLDETGDYPETVGILVYGTTTMRTRGDDVAEIFYLMGVKPIWQAGSGNVSGLEVIPAQTLGRPRLDVSPRISGFFRDAFPNLVERIDQAVRMIAALKEPPERNFLRRHVLKDMTACQNNGMSDDDAWREATLRIFGCPPGSYGAGVAELVESKSWKTREDLGEIYIHHSSHAYGRGIYGDQKPGTYRRILSRMDVTVKNEDSREYDMMSCTDYYNYYGGLIAAAGTVRGRLPFAVMGDAADPRRVRMRTTAEEARHLLRARLVNPKWLEGMKRHGYKGAGDISKMMDVALGWDATADVMEDWMYTAMADKYALDPQMQQWMKSVNPYALHNILDRLLEAVSRGMWYADPEREAQLRDAYLEMEGEIEELTE